MKEKIDVQKPDDLGLDISDLRYFLVMLLFSAVVFFLLISQRLTNTFDMRCGKAPTEPSARCWTAPCSAHPS